MSPQRADQPAPRSNRAASPRRPSSVRSSSSLARGLWAIDTPAFPTPDGRAHLAVHDLPPAPEGLQLMTIRSEGQFNTVVYEEEDLYRNQTRRDIVLIHPDDIARFGLVAGGRCRIRSAAGEMRGQFVSAFDQIRPGSVAMYYPESNVLVPKAADPLSRTPAYKSIAVAICPQSTGPPGPRTRAARSAMIATSARGPTCRGGPPSDRRT